MEEYDNESLFTAERVAMLALGAMIGAAITVYLTPDPVEYAKKQLRKERDHLKKRANKRFHEARASGEDWLGAGSEYALDWTDQIADAVVDGVETIRSTVADEVKRMDKKYGKKRGPFGVFGRKGRLFG